MTLPKLSRIATVAARSGNLVVSAAASNSISRSLSNFTSSSPLNLPPIIASNAKVNTSKFPPSLFSLTGRLSNLSLLGNKHAPIVQPFSSLPPSHLLTSPPSEPITVLTLSNLTDNPGATHKSRRIGRGIGSSKGKTSGRGHKGQKSRAGRGVHPTFEGGQTKFYKRLPKVGRMKNAKFKLELIPLNIGRVQDYVTMGRLKPERGDGVLTMRDFVKAGMFPASSVKSGVKLLGGGREQLKDRLLIEVPWASSSAIEAVEKKGGYVTTVHHNRLAVRAALKPEKFPLKPESMVEDEEGKTANADVEDLYLLPKRASPPPKYMQYYTDYSKRGYLNPKVQLERKKLGLKEIH